MNPLKVIIADTFAGEEWLHEKYLKTFPRAQIRNWKHPMTPSCSPHPHGGQVASVILLSLRDTPVNLYFVRWLDADHGTPEDYILDVIEDVEPDLVHCSWGQAPQRNLGGAITESWQPWIDREAKLRARFGYWLVSSMGNDDTYGLSFANHDHPWRDMDGVVCVASNDRDGVVTTWTSDGPKCVCSAVGNARWLLNPLTGEWETGAGTSFSSPAVSGVILNLMSDGVIGRDFGQFVRWCDTHATRPDGIAVPDPKFGYGCIEHEWQVAVRSIDANRRCGVPRVDIRSIPLAWAEMMRL